MCTTNIQYWGVPSTGTSTGTDQNQLYYRSTPQQPRCLAFTCCCAQMLGILQTCAKGCIVVTIVCSTHYNMHSSANGQLAEESFLEEEASTLDGGDDGGFQSIARGWSSNPKSAELDTQNIGWVRHSMRRSAIMNGARFTQQALHVEDNQARNSPIPLQPILPMHAIKQEGPPKSAPAASLGHQLPVLANLRKHGIMIFFFFSLVGLTVLVWFGIKHIYTDPAILVGRFCAASTIVCFSVFLFPFVRVFQGQMYDKLAEFASFFNPHLHKTLGLAFIAVGTFHGILWNVATWRSCEGTWCPKERYSEALDQIACIQTFCHQDTLPFDAYARGGLPSFSAAFSTLPSNSNLRRSQAPIRSFYLGFISWILFAVIGIFTFPRIRREHFELFYYSHHLFIVAIPFFFVHCWTLDPPSFHIQLMIIPCGIATLAYACDKVYSILFRRYVSATVDTIFYSDDRILEIRFRPVPKWTICNMFSFFFAKESQSQALVDSTNNSSTKPKFFAPGNRFVVLYLFQVVNHFVGAYMDINCPAISKFQWHPFTVSKLFSFSFFHVLSWCEMFEVPTFLLLGVSPDFFIA